MNDRPVQTGSVPYSIIDAGLIARLTMRELQAYVIICGHANRKTLESSPGVKRIARLMGRKERTAERAIGGLVSKGFVRIHRGGGRGVTNRYVLEENPDNIAVTVSGKETPSDPPSKPRQNRGETPSDLSLNPDTQGGGQTIEQLNNQTTGVVVGSFPVGGGDGRTSQAVIDALVMVGIAEPTLSRLAALEGITAELVKRVAQRTKATGGGVGAIVRAIEAEVQAEEARRRDAERRREAAAQRQAKRAQKAVVERDEHEQFVAQQEQIDRFIDALDDDALARETEAVLAELDAPTQNFHRRRDPRKNHFLKQRIYERRWGTDTTPLPVAQINP